MSSRNVVKPSFFLNNFDFRGGKTAHFCVNQCKSAVFAGMTLQNSNYVDEFTVLYSTLQYFTVLYSMLFAFFAKDEVTTCNNQTTRLDALGHPLTILPWQWKISMLHSANSQSIGRRATFCHVFSKIGILALRLREQSACFAELA